MMDDRPSIVSAVSSWFKRVKQFFRPTLDERQQLIDLLHRAEQRNLIDSDTEAMMEGALLVSETQVRDIMIPRADVVFIEEDQSPRDFLPTVIESGHSRFPMLDDKREKVLGVLLAKDLLPLLGDERRAEYNLRDILRPAIFVPESKRLNILLREFRNNRNHLAIVVDEYGTVEGIVSIEDVIEQIVGEIGDEHDIDDETSIRQHRDNRYTVRARTTIVEFNEYFGTDFSDDEYDTIGGLVIDALGHLPIRGEEVDIGGHSFKILRADKRRVHLLRVMRAGDGDSDDRDEQPMLRDTG